MGQNSSTKIVSLHMERCVNNNCPHRSMCYHLNKKLNNQDNFILGLRGRVWMLRKGWQLHESICNGLKAMHWHLLKFYDNYNITIPCDQYEPYLDRVKDQVQITVYNEEQAETFKDYQKLFLIKDDETWDFFLKHSNMGFATHKMHYILEQEYINKDKLRIVAEHKMFANTFSITVDSCFTSFILNGRCPYSYNNYIDITFDGTVRFCPYAKEGIQMPVDLSEVEKLFKVKALPKKCIYSELFGGELDVAKHGTSLQNNSPDNEA